MNYQSSNPEVRAILDRPRWLEWIDYEVGHIDYQTAMCRVRGLSSPKLLGATSDRAGRFLGNFVYGQPVQVYLEGYVRRYALRPGGFHEVAELVEVMARCLPLAYHRFLHRDLTSSNVIDGCNHARWIRLWGRLHHAISQISTDGGGWTVVGFTHGRAAHTSSLGHRLKTTIGAIQRLDADPPLDCSVEGGPTGLGTFHRQCWPRWDYWPLWSSLARVAAACDQIATDYRFYCSDFASVVGVMGTEKSPTTSSAMPGKQNPTAFERVCSVSHLVRTMVASQLTLPAQWLDRDLVHSAHERETIDRMWDHTFWLVEEVKRLLDSTTLEVTGELIHSSHDHMNLLLDQGMDYLKAREEAVKFPTG